MKEYAIIDAGVEHIKINFYGENKQSFLIQNNDSTSILFKKHNVLSRLQNTDVFITGKLANVVKETLGRGEVIAPGAAIWSAVKRIQKGSAGILDISASGFMIICVDEKGRLINDTLEVNPKCGAGSGINLRRILEKLDIPITEVDNVVKDYIGENAKDKRSSVNVRSDRCGVFSSSATISDKNQGIPLELALAVTLKSEVLKACRKLVKVDSVWLTGRVFLWEYARDCARDYLKSIGVKKIYFDKEQNLIMDGVKSLVLNLGRNFRTQEKPIRRKKKITEYPSFGDIKKELQAKGLYKKENNPTQPSFDTTFFESVPVNIGLDIGSTMAKMVISDATTKRILFWNSYNNHGDTINTVKHIFSDLKKKGISRLNIQNIGITGSGRYQVKKVLGEIYPKLKGKIIALVENYAHAYGSIDFAKEYIENTKGANKDFCVIVDIGGEDTKVSIISLKKEELFDNVMNIKCSAGTGSLMDTLKTLFNIQNINEAYLSAFNAPRSYDMNATCAVFLMENAKKMQSMGFSKDEILASCCFAIVENMARTLWNQIDFPKNAVVLLHGQTMLSEPLPLAVARRIQDSKMFCIVPPLPGHRACIGLINMMKSEIKENFCELSDLLDVNFERNVFICHGAACGDNNSSCIRTLLTNSANISITLGGCSAVNEMDVNKSNKSKVAYSYKELWNLINSALPTTDNKKRIIIPRSFQVSESAFFFSKIFEKLGVPVHVDNVIDKDILEGTPHFTIDACAPFIGCVGQLMRLSREPHSFILIPQIDFIPTANKSLGRTCTTNQGGILIAKQLASLQYPKANYLVFDLAMDRMEESYLSHQLLGRLQPIVKAFGLKLDFEKLREAIRFAIDENEKLKNRAAEKAAEYIEQAIEKKENISIVCAREYILNPGIYDSHIGKLLRDKGVIAIPSYVINSELDEDYSYVYWKNPHELLTKISAISEKKLHTIIKNKKLSESVRKIEKGLTDSMISITQVSTFRCGPDTMISPTANEITKNIPSLYIQSDGMIKELAHLENRVNTHINQMEKRLHEEFSREKFSIKRIDQFGLKGINKKTDVIYCPTVQDNRAMVSVFRAAGYTTIDNFDEDTFDLEERTRLGRKFCGDFICSPLAATFAEMVMAVEDFIKMKKANDPRVKGKKRVVILDIKGTGPCRQGQYYEQHKLFLHKKYNNTPSADLIRVMVGEEKNAYNMGMEEWALVLAFQSVVVKAVLHQINLTYGGRCRNLEEFRSFEKDFREFKESVFYLLENSKPNKSLEKTAMAIGKKSKIGGAVGKYYIYGLYNNLGLRKIFCQFRKKWLRAEKPGKIKVHIEGEAYMRVAQLVDIYEAMIDALGFDSFEMYYSPLWCYLEYLLYIEAVDLEEENIILEKEYCEKKSEKIKNEIKGNEKKIKQFGQGLFLLRKILAQPLYDAASIDMPHPMKEVLSAAKQIFPTLKPRGELAVYTGEAIIKLNEGIDIFFNVAPESCMVASMGQTITPAILNIVKNKKARIQGLFSLNGEVENENIQMALLKKFGPERYYRKV